MPANRNRRAVGWTTAAESRSRASAVRNGSSADCRISTSLKVSTPVSAARAAAIVAARPP